MKKHPGVTARAVRYLKLPEIRRRRLKVGDLPFLKRFPYEDEREFRIIYESKQRQGGLPGSRYSARMHPEDHPQSMDPGGAHRRT